ncbi:hypothetical protein KOW79_000486 [Hemibagrus wyckioides]|uniref:Uncharacterized protein n=1 Tax=Hemibagrus wyckioides TaxID=337641 RepID=A0A9D3SYM3_9TELE|nr:hypothetical protein KOW79_000486 [Hemibagrus wyckioides]
MAAPNRGANQRPDLSSMPSLNLNPPSESLWNQIHLLSNSSDIKKSPSNNSLSLYPVARPRHLSQPTDRISSQWAFGTLVNKPFSEKLTHAARDHCDPQTSLCPMTSFSSPKSSPVCTRYEQMHRSA